MAVSSAFKASPRNFRTFSFPCMGKDSSSPKFSFQLEFAQHREPLSIRNVATKDFAMFTSFLQIRQHGFPFRRSRSKRVTCPRDPRFSPQRSRLTKPLALLSQLLFPIRTSGGATSQPRGSLREGWQFPFQLYLARIRARARTVLLCRRCWPTRVAREIRPLLQPDPRGYRQTCSR